MGLCATLTMTTNDRQEFVRLPVLHLGRSLKTKFAATYSGGGGNIYQAERPSLYGHALCSLLNALSQERVRI